MNVVKSIGFWGHVHFPNKKVESIHIWGSKKRKINFRIFFKLFFANDIYMDLSEKNSIVQDKIIFVVVVIFHIHDYASIFWCISKIIDNAKMSF